jgi:hypothetical protein
MAEDTVVEEAVRLRLLTEAVVAARCRRTVEAAAVLPLTAEDTVVEEAVHLRLPMAAEAAGVVRQVEEAAGVEPSPTTTAAAITAVARG